MRARLTQDLKATEKGMKVPVVEREGYPWGVVPAGTELEGKLALLYLDAGVAEPVDDEAREKYPPAVVEDKARRQEAMAAGIVPEDRDAFFAGKLEGYNADGTWKRGPNYVEGDEPGDEPELDEDDEL